LGQSILARSFAEFADHRFDYLDLGPLLDRSALMVCQGGTGTAYAALEAGVPVVTIPSHRNHEILGRLIEQRGFGVCWSGEPDRSEHAPTEHGVDWLSMRHRTRTAAAANRPLGRWKREFERQLP
jgi:UDP-N-acetylglucosamine:LPS N-acetylglucosamine transferase